MAHGAIHRFHLRRPNTPFLPGLACGVAATICRYLGPKPEPARGELEIVSSWQAHRRELFSRREKCLDGMAAQTFTATLFSKTLLRSIRRVPVLIQSSNGTFPENDC